MSFLLEELSLQSFVNIDMFWANPKIAPFPHAIIHVDGDAFFATVEQAIHPELKGRPVITGKERGIVSAASYEAKALGIQRGIPLGDVKKICPDAVIMPSDYETYSLFSKRMFNIMRRYTNVVEEYGIDEGFMDITGMRGPHHMSYKRIAAAVKKDIQEELDITVSVGLAATKVLSKLASKYNKPNGLTIISNRERAAFLTKRPAGYIWGVGRNTEGYMAGLGIRSAWDFANMPYERVEMLFTKPVQELWHEMNGEKVYPVNNQSKTSYASISKTKTFTPPSMKTSFIFSQLSKNLENACIKARRYNLVARRLTVLLKTQEFKTRAVELKLTRSSAYPNELTKVLADGFDKIFQPGVLYRATGVTLSHLHEDESIQSTLFESPVQLEKLKRVYQAVDTVAGRFGKHSIHLGSSLAANKNDQHGGARGDIAHRKKSLLKGEGKRQRVGLPMAYVKGI